MPLFYRVTGCWKWLGNPRVSVAWEVKGHLGDERNQCVHGDHKIDDDQCADLVSNYVGQEQGAGSLGSIAGQLSSACPAFNDPCCEPGGLQLDPWAAVL